MRFPGILLKGIGCAAALLCSAGAFAQPGMRENEIILQTARAYVKSLVRDSSGGKTSTFTIVNRKLTASRGRYITYTYRTYREGSLQWVKTSQATRQAIYNNAYYLRGGRLYFSAEAVAANLKSGETGWGWEGIYVFENGKLTALSSLGHGKSETEEWDPDVYVPKEFARVRTNAERHFRKLR